ncbi:MAG TPA: DMT family transporter [Spirochaetia bacterium]|nr:DMT family transporter [Spirochaetia bacterium]
MEIRLLALLVAAAAGVAMAFQGTLNAMLGKVSGLWETTFIVHAMGLVLAGVLLFGFRLGDGSLVVKAPWYSYLGGFIGVLIIYGVARSIPPVGVAGATTAIILGQVFTAAILDYFGLFGLEKIPFNWYRILGAMAMAGGAWLMLRRQ